MGRKSSRAPIKGLGECISGHVVDCLLDQSYDVKVKDKNGKMPERNC
jgi:hypothetical protein